MIIMKEVERGGGDFISLCEQVVVVVVYHMIIMKEVEKGGGVFISFYEPVVVVAYYMIAMQEVERGGGDFVLFHAKGSRSHILYDYDDYYARCGEGRRRRFVCLCVRDE